MDYSAYDKQYPNLFIHLAINIGEIALLLAFVIFVAMVLKLKSAKKRKSFKMFILLDLLLVLLSLLYASFVTYSYFEHEDSQPVEVTKMEGHFPPEDGKQGNLQAKNMWVDLILAWTAVALAFYFLTRSLSAERFSNAMVLQEKLINI